MKIQNAERIRRATEEVVAKGNFDAVEEFFSSDYQAHAGGKDFGGIDFVKRFGKQLHTAIPDLEVEDVTIFQEYGDTIAWQRTLSGTHQCKMKGIPASGKKVTWRDMLITRFVNGLIAEEWIVSELAGELFAEQPAAGSTAR